jgi:hypothetical protein
MNTLKEKDIEKVKQLKHEETCYINWYDGGGGEVRRIGDTLLLIEIPQYGVELTSEGYFEISFELDEAEKLVELAHTWN